MWRSIPLTSDAGFIRHRSPVVPWIQIVERSGICVQVPLPEELADWEAAKSKIREIEFADANGVYVAMDPVPGYENWKLIDDNRQTNPLADERAPSDGSLPLDGTAYQESEE